MSQFESAATTVWATDNAVGSVIPYLSTNDSHVAMPITGTGTPIMNCHYGSNIAARHLETINVLYTDGHVKAVKLNALATTVTKAGNTVYTAFTVQDN